MALHVFLGTSILELKLFSNETFLVISDKVLIKDTTNVLFHDLKLSYLVNQETLLSCFPVLSHFLERCLC